MENKSFFQMLKKALKAIFLPTHGKLLKHDVEIPDEVYEFKKEILSDMKMKSFSQDKINLRNDSQQVRKDIRKSVSNFYELV